MKLNYLMLIVICGILCFTACVSSSSVEDEKTGKNEELTYGGKSSSMPYTKGEVVEIGDGNTVVIDVKVNSDGYKIGDRIRVKYDEYVEQNVTSPTLEEKEVTPKLGDIICIQYWQEDVNREGELDLITVLDATIYVEEFSDEKAKENEYMKVIEGKIVEVVDDNTILLEITKERGGVCVGDNVKVRFEKYLEENVVAVPNVGDVVGVQFLELEKEEDLIVVKEVYKHSK